VTGVTSDETDQRRTGAFSHGGVELLLHHTVIIRRRGCIYQGETLSICLAIRAFFYWCNHTSSYRWGNNQKCTSTSA
jgi:hypothetical protein